MSFPLPPNPAPTPGKTYISLPPETDPPQGFFSAKFVIIAILAAGALTFAGLIQTGKISLHRSSTTPKASAPPTALAWVTNSLSTTKAALAANSARVSEEIPPANSNRTTKPVPPAPVAPLKPDTFTVTSISIGQPSIAIINGISRAEGDPVEAPGVTGWRVRQILDDTVILQNGPTQTTLPISTPGIKPLDDQLHPLN